MTQKLRANATLLVQEQEEQQQQQHQQRMPGLRPRKHSEPSPVSSNHLGSSGGQPLPPNYLVRPRVSPFLFLVLPAQAGHRQGRSLCCNAAVEPTKAKANLQVVQGQRNGRGALPRRSAQDRPRPSEVSRKREKDTAHQ